MLVARGATTGNVVFAGAAGAGDRVPAHLDGRVAAAERRCPPFFPLAADGATAAEQALVFASMCDRVEVVRLLLDRGVNADARYEATPLGWAEHGFPWADAAARREVADLLRAAGG